MKRTMVTILITLVIVLVTIILLFFAYKHFILDNIKDKGGMENPYADDINHLPSEGAKLISCSLNHSGEMADDNYNYTLKQVSDEVLLSINDLTEDGDRREIENKKIALNDLSELNNLVLTFNLDQNDVVVSQTGPELSDGSSKLYILEWDDGTIIKKINGYNEIKEYFDREILSQIGE